MRDRSSDGIPHNIRHDIIRERRTLSVGGMVVVVEVEVEEGSDKLASSRYPSPRG